MMMMATCADAHISLQINIAMVIRMMARFCAGRVQGFHAVEGVGSPVAKGAVACGRVLATACGRACGRSPPSPSSACGRCEAWPAPPVVCLLACGRCQCVGLWPWQQRTVYQPRAAHAGHRTLACWGSALGRFGSRARCSAQVS